MDPLTIIITAVIVLAGFLSSILVIWNFIEKAKKSFTHVVNEHIDKALDKNNSNQETLVRTLIEASEVKQQTLIESSRKEQLAYLEGLKEAATIQKNIQDKRDSETDHLFKAIIALHMEQIKKHIREAHAKMRKEGLISDYDMAYIDKIYPHYRELGGNSDISGRVSEMHRIHDLTIVEQMDTKRKRKYNKQNKDKDLSNPEEELKERLINKHD